MGGKRETQDGRIATSFRLTPQLKAAIRAEAQRRNASRRPGESRWEDWRVVETLIWTALGGRNEASR